MNRFAGCSAEEVEAELACRRCLEPRSGILASGGRAPRLTPGSGAHQDGSVHAVSAAKKSREPILAFSSAAEWHTWLASHHGRFQAIQLRIAKMGARRSLTYAEALDVALAWGWIDSQKRALDANTWLQRFTPRRAKSPWSKINRTKAEALIAAGTMEPRGLAEVERAKRDGRWERAYDGARTSGVPPDLAAALARNARAQVFFDALDGANRYAILYRVQTAKKPETRAERIARLVAMCARHERIHPPRRATTRTRFAKASGKAPRAKE
jgi:uncharacterized protein YdeI (YjbR/CyaY-like superfamily)